MQKYVPYLIYTNYSFNQKLQQQNRKYEGEKNLSTEICRTEEKISKVWKGTQRNKSMYYVIQKSKVHCKQTTKSCQIASEQ